MTTESDTPRDRAMQLVSQMIVRMQIKGYSLKILNSSLQTKMIADQLPSDLLANLIDAASTRDPEKISAHQQRAVDFLVNGWSS